MIVEKIVEGGGDYLFVVKDNYFKFCVVIVDYFEMVYNDGFIVYGVWVMMIIGK